MIGRPRGSEPFFLLNDGTHMFGTLTRSSSGGAMAWSGCRRLRDFYMRFNAGVVMREWQQSGECGYQGVPPACTDRFIAFRAFLHDVCRLLGLREEKTCMRQTQCLKAREKVEGWR
jgi:hypothetical protein